MSIRTAAALLLLTGCAIAGGRSPVAAQATLPQAQQAMVRGENKTALTLLDEVLASQPGNARALNMRGVVLRRLGRWKDAVASHREVPPSDSLYPVALYWQGLAFAQGGRPDSAFYWLLKAKATGRVNLVDIVQDTAARSLLRDPRFGSLMPSPEELADPFLERTSVIHEWKGEATGDQFGWIGRNIGDVDRDGVADLVTSAPTNAEGGANAGKIYVYSGRSGVLLWSAVGAAGGQLGLGVEAAGDFNGDGTPDVAAGAPLHDRVYVYHGRTGALIRTLSGDQRGAAFGRRVAPAGDVNGDGYEDLLVGAPLYDSAAQDAGRVYVFSGADSSVLFVADGEAAGDGLGNALDGATIDGESWIVAGAAAAGPGDAGRVYVYRRLKRTPAFTIHSESSSVALGGMFVSVIGDVDADGVSDVYASDWSDGSKGAGSGRIVVHSGADGSRLLIVDGEAAGDGFGIGPADAGDVNGDGHDDIIVGAWRHSSAARAGGRVYLYSGADGRLLHTWTADVQGETLGFDATGMGDVDGDGVPDFLVTSAWSAVNGPNSGRMFILSGADAIAPSDSAAIAAVEQAFVAAWLADDTTAVLSLLTDDVVLMPAGREPIVGKEAARAYWWPADGSRTTITAYRSDPIEIVVDGHLAYTRERSSLAWVYEKDGNRQEQQTRSVGLAIFRREQPGKWRIARRAWSALP